MNRSSFNRTKKQISKISKIFKAQHRSSITSGNLRVKGRRRMLSSPEQLQRFPDSRYEVATVIEWVEGFRSVEVRLFADWRSVDAIMRQAVNIRENADGISAVMLQILFLNSGLMRCYSINANSDFAKIHNRLI